MRACIDQILASSRLSRTETESAGQASAIEIADMAIQSRINKGYPWSFDVSYRMTNGYGMVILEGVQFYD